MHLQRCQNYVTTHRQEIDPEKWIQLFKVVRSLIVLYFDRAICLDQEKDENIRAILGSCDVHSDPQLLCILADRILSSGLTTPAVYKSFQVSSKSLP